MSKRKLKEEIVSLKADLKRTQNDSRFWKKYAGFVEDKWSSVKEAIEVKGRLEEENAGLKRALADIRSDFDTLRRNSGFACAYCRYDSWFDKDYCDRCKNNGYSDWKWRGENRDEGHN